MFKPIIEGHTGNEWPFYTNIYILLYWTLSWELFDPLLTPHKIKALHQREKGREVRAIFYNTYTLTLPYTQSAL